MLTKRVNLNSKAWIAPVIIVLSLVVVFTGTASAEEHLELLHEFHNELHETEDPISFDHIDTGFPLTGTHANLPCEQCHQSGVFERLPKRCDYCHNNELAVGKPANHVVTNAPCDTCHTVAAFMPDSGIDHGSFVGRCISCHNGQLQTAKPETHITSSDDCDACHNSHAWIPVTVVDHTQLIVGSCIFCHNEIYARGKDPINHMATSNACEACHSPSIGSWSINYMDHGQVNGVCESCHNRVLASGPDDGHLGTLVNCDACHNVVDWSVIFYDHDYMPNKQCVACHDGIMTAGKSSEHIASSNICQACHNVGAYWQANYAIDHNEVRGLCKDCHLLPGNHKSIQSDCSRCHTVSNWGNVTNDAEK